MQGAEAVDRAPASKVADPLPGHQKVLRARCALGSASAGVTTAWRDLPRSGVPLSGEATVVGQEHLAVADGIAQVVRGGWGRAQS